MIAERKPLLPWEVKEKGTLHATVTVNCVARNHHFPAEVTVIWLNGHLKVIKAEMQVQPNRMVAFDFEPKNLFPANKKGLERLKIEAAFSASFQAEELLCRLDELLRSQQS